jgi:hypothetical protein
MSKHRRATKHNSSHGKTFSLIAQREANTPDYYVSQEMIPLPFGPRGEQQEIDAWKALITNSDFREDIKKSQQSLGMSYWKDLSKWQTARQQLNSELTKSFTATLNLFEQNHPDVPLSVRPSLVELRHESEIERLLTKWALDDLTDGDWWLEYLLRFWDTPLRPPMRTIPLDLPPGSTYVHRETPLFKAAMASVEYFASSSNDSDKAKPRRVTITLRPGVSGKQAGQAATEAVKRLDSKPKPHRPGLTDLDRGWLRICFSVHEGLGCCRFS